MMTSNGGVQFVPQIAVQYVYLDFDGELTDYNGEILTIEGVEVRDSKLTQARIADILAELNKKYASQNVIFVTERPATAEYSTIFIGKTEAFDRYGNFAGLAETVDFNNQNRSDNAFVNLDSTATNEQIISTISHETDHLLGDFDHGGVGLEPYAYTVSTVTSISSLYRGPGSWIQSAGIGSDGICYIDVGGGSAYSTSIYAGGSMFVSNNGKVVDTTIYSGGILSVGVLGSASNTIINSGGSMYVHAGAACAENIDIRYGGTLSLWYNNTLATILFNPWRGNIVVTGGAKVQYYDRDANVYLGNNILGVVSKYDSVNQLYVNSDLVAIVYSGGLSYKSFIENGSMLVSSGGMVNFTSVGFAGNMHVLYCGVASKTFVSDYASMSISSGGFAEKTTVEECGEMCISSGGVANSTTVNYGGSMYISSSGMHRGSLQINREATVSAYSGAVIDFTLNDRSVSEGYLINDLSLICGTPTFTITVSDNQGSGTYKLAQGANSFTGSITIGDGTTSYGSVTVNGENFIYNDIVYSLDQADGNLTLTIAEPEKPAAVFIYSSGTLTSSGSTISDATLAEGGNNSMHVSSGGVANNTTVNSGDMSISSGGVANRTTVNSSGWMRISSGGVANSTTVNSSGYMYISGGVANRTTVNSSGWMVIKSGGVANSTTVNSSGSMFISSGGTAAAIRENGGYVNVANGANVTFVSNTIEGLTLSFYTSMTVHKNTVANSTTLSGGGMYISSGGVANNTTINDWGSMYISSGGVANNTTVNSGGSMYISFGGVANSTTVNTYGVMHISSGGVANSTTVNDEGNMCIWSGGVANSTTMDGGAMCISSGGTANSTTMDGGYMHISRGGVANSTTVNSGGHIRIYSGGVANSTTVNSGGDVYISSGGSANSTTVNSCGGMYIHSGGTANNTTVNSWGYMFISSGGVANNTTVNSRGSMYISTGGVANSTTVNSGGDMYISSGVVANSTTVNSGGWMSISSGGTATSITALDGAELHVIVASDTYIQGTYNGSAFEMKDAQISGYTINSDCGMRISTGGVANSTTVNSGGDMSISSGGVANSTTVTSGFMDISSGGVANSTTVNSGGDMYISSGGTATAIRENGGYVDVWYGANVTFVSNTIEGLTLSGNMTVHKNTVANSTTLSGGGMYISSGGVANSTTVNSSGWMYISSGGVANSTTVNSGGYMSISFGGVHRGTLQINSGATVSAYNGAAIDFTLTARSASNGYLINDLSRIYGTPTFTITVSDSQEGGTYKLAQGASSFSGSITIGTDTLDYGTLAVNGSAVENDTQSYRLVKTDGNLNLVVEDKTAALPDLRMAEYDVSSNNITTQESVKLTFKVYNDGDADAPASMIKVYDGDKLLREVALGEIAAGSYRNCYITLTAGKLSVGTHKVNVVLDSGNIIAESREDNNNSYRTIFVKAPAVQADLRMAEYDVSSNSITTQESVRLTFTVYNDGNAYAPASMIKVYDGDTLLREVALGEIAAGAYRNCYITIPAGKLSVGTHKINVVLDAGNGIAESNENNNNSYRTIFVKAATAQPDLRMAEYDVSSNNITTQESVKLTFKVFNDGDAIAPASTIKVYDGDILLREVALGEIDAGGYRNCYITLTAGKLSVGTHKVNVVLDSGNLIAESNESNNNSYRTIFVKEPVRSSALADKADNAWDVAGTGSVDALCGGNYADLNEWSLENFAALTRSAADILTTGNEESRLLNSGKLAG